MSKSSAAASRRKLIKLVQIALLTAIIVIMTFTPLGYLKTPGLEITLIPVPVVIGAVLLGPASGLFLGTVFGLTSFIQCFSASAFGIALMSVNPVFTFITCMVPRMLMGWLTSLIFKAIRKVDKTKFVSYLVASIAGPLLNTVLFTSTLLLLFSKAPIITEMQATLGSANLFTFAVAFVGINGLIEVGICAVAGTAISAALAAALKKMKI